MHLCISVPLLSTLSTFALFISPFLSSFSHPLLLFWSYPSFCSSLHSSFLILSTALLFSPLFFLSLLISHLLRSPVYLISRLSKGGVNRPQESHQSSCCRSSTWPLCVCVHVCTLKQWMLTTSFCRYTRGHKHTQADTNCSEHT